MPLDYSLAFLGISLVAGSVLYCSPAVVVHFDANMLIFVWQMGWSGGHRAVGRVHTKQQPSGACLRLHVLVSLAAGTHTAGASIDMLLYDWRATGISARCDGGALGNSSRTFFFFAAAATN